MNPKASDREVEFLLRSLEVDILLGLFPALFRLIFSVWFVLELKIGYRIAFNRLTMCAAKERL